MLHSQASVYNLALFLIDVLYVSVPVARPCLLRLHQGYSCGNVTNLSRLIIYTNSPELVFASSSLPKGRRGFSLFLSLSHSFSFSLLRIIDLLLEFVRLRSFLA